MEPPRDVEAKFCAISSCNFGDAERVNLTRVCKLLLCIPGELSDPLEPRLKYVASFDWCNDFNLFSFNYSCL